MISAALSEQPTALRAPKPTNGRRVPRERRDRDGQEGVRPALKSFEAVLTHVRRCARGREIPQERSSSPRAQKASTLPAKPSASPAYCSRPPSGVSWSTSPVAQRPCRGVSRYRGHPASPICSPSRVGFEEVIHVDGETALQVIPAGHPTVRYEGNEIDRAIGIFDALAQAYDVVVFHADRDGASQMAPALAGRLSVAVAVLETGGGTSARAALADLNALGCPPLVTYERHDGDEGFGRATAV